MAATGEAYKRPGRLNTIHLPDNLRPRTCQCGDRAVWDDGTCALCGKAIMRAVPSVEPEPAKDRGDWTRESVVRAMRLWAVRAGGPPKHAQWVRADRGPGFPSTTQVVQLFGTWKAALLAAGFTPPAQGRKPIARAVG